jgi:hypothetical protein
MPRFAIYALASASLLLVATAGAQEDSLSQRLIDAKFQLSVGIFYPERQFHVKVNGSASVPNEEIRFDEELKLKTRDEIFAAEGVWNIGERWRLEGQYFAASNSASHVLEEDIEWEDIVFETGSSIAGKTSTQVVRLFLGWKFYTAPHHDFGVGFGIHQLDLRASIEGQALVQNVTTEYRSESVRTQAPLPDIGVWYNRVLSPRWAMTSRLDWLEVSIKPYDGAIINASVGFKFALSENFGAGLNYNYFELDAGIRDDDWRGSVEIRYHGPYLSIDAYW